VIILNERHLKRLMSSYVLYYHEDRTHLGLVKDTPASRPTEIRSGCERKIQSFPRLGGLHHRYAVAASIQEPFSDDKTFLRVTRPRTVHVFCEHLWPVDESACNPKPKSLRQTGRNPLNVGRQRFGERQPAKREEPRPVQEPIAKQKTAVPQGAASLSLAVLESDGRKGK
jgi:hypothetical protein